MDRLLTVLSTLLMAAARIAAIMSPLSPMGRPFAMK